MTRLLPSQVFKSWGYWSHSGAVTTLRAFVGSEDKATFSAMPPLLRPYGAYWIPASYFLMDGSKGKKFVDIRQGNSRLGQLYGALEDQAAKGGAAASLPAAAAASAAAGTSASAAAGTSAAAAESWHSPLQKDEGMVLIAQILLMSGCEALVASYSSNVAVLVHDLMLARKVARGEPLHAMDINGRVYCGCGASFCMNLERKTVREGGRSIKKVIDGFKY